MKAIVSEEYGSPSQLKMVNIARPIAKPNEVLVRVKATSLNYGNIALLYGKPYPVRLFFGLKKPKYRIPGVDMAGVVTEVGEGVQAFKVGDEVFGELSACGFGSFAEYVAVPETFLAPKPTTISFEEAASLPMSALTALQALRNYGHVKEGERVLIYGASGGVGTYALQIAKALGAHVTAVCSTRKMPLVQSLGADKIIDYKVEDFTKKTDTYDVILGVNGYQPISVYKKALNKGGRYVMVGGTGKQMSEAFMYGRIHSLFGTKKLGNMYQKANKEDLLFVKQLVEEGKLQPIIDREFSFNETVAAFQYFEQRHANGKVVVTI